HNRIQIMEGNMKPTNQENAGMHTFGFDNLTTDIGANNYDYYPTHLEQLGFVKEKEWVENIINAPETIPDKIHQFSDLVKERYHLKVLDFKSAKEMQPYIKPVFDLLEE